MQLDLKELQKTLTMSWPSPQDYNEALQNPAYCFSDPVLASGQTELNRLGLPLPRSGMFASVYKVHGGNSDWAVRCFLQSKPDQVRRYVQIKDTLLKASLPCFVPFDLQEEGIRVAGHTFPMLKMQWCQGEPLNYWLEKNLRSKSTLEDFLESWRATLQTLSSAGIAHGDLQHGNILIQDGQIKLVDYDGVYVPEFKGMQPTELGHRSYQHPQRNESHFGPYLDNFSAWLIYLSVLISGCDPHVWQDFEGGDECLLFRRQDLDNPLDSELFHVLEHHRNPQIRESSRTLRYLLTLSPENVPGLQAPVAIPEDLPELDSVISDLPEWVPTTPTSEGSPSGKPGLAAVAPLVPEGKRLMKRRRHRGVPLKPEGELSVNGRWLYDEHGLSFARDEGPGTSGSPALAGSISALTLQSTIIDRFNSPAPYRNINGKLHSPIFEDDSLTSDLPGDSLNPQGMYDIIPGWLKIVFFVLVFICFVYTATHPRIKADHWPQGQYVRLVDGLKAMRAGDNEKAEHLFLQGISELKEMNDSKAQLNLAQTYYNLGIIHNRQGQYLTAEDDFKQSLDEWRRQSGDNTYDYARVLIELAQTMAKGGGLEPSEHAYNQALQILQDNGVTAQDPVMKDAIAGYVAVLRQDHKDQEAARAESMLPK